MTLGWLAAIGLILVVLGVAVLRARASRNWTRDLDGPVYLCGGINGLSDADAMDWRAEATELLDGDVLDPMARDYRGKEDENVEAIVQGDKADILTCRAVLAYCKRPSWGTAMEIFFAWSLGIPVTAVVPEGPVSPWLRAHTVAVVRTIPEGVEAVKA